MKYIQGAVAKQEKVYRNYCFATVPNSNLLYVFKRRRLKEIINRNKGGA